MSLLVLGLKSRCLRSYSTVYYGVTTSNTRPVRTLYDAIVVGAGEYRSAMQDPMNYEAAYIFSLPGTESFVKDILVSPDWVY